MLNLLRFCTLFTVLCLISFACNNEQLPLDETIEKSVPKKDSIRSIDSYLALGDSYTIGQSVDQNKRFPAQLFDSLNKRGLSLEGYDIVARTGWTVSELATAIESTRSTLKEKYDNVTLLIGVNDQYRGYSVEGYEKSFPEILETAITFAGGDSSKVLVISIPDYAYTPFGGGREAISKGIDEYNEVNKKVSEERGVKWLNITDISRMGLSSPELVASDGLHPSAIQYSLWVERIVQSLIIRD